MTPRLIRVQRRGKAGPAAPGTVDLYFENTLRQWRYVDEDGSTYALGSSSHAALTVLDWASSGHTGTAGALAGFSGAGVATYYQIGVAIQAYDAGLTSLTSADATAGLPYVTAANTWSTATLGDLAVSGGAWQVTQARGLRETGGPTTLAMGAVADGRLLGRNGTTIGGVTVSTGLSLSAGSLAVDTTTIATVAAVAAGYQPLDADLTALAALGDGLPYRSSGTWSASTGYRDALAGSSGSPSSSNPYVTSDDSRLTGVGGGAAVGAAAEYGTGANGNLTLDGTNTYAGLTLAGSTYTVDAAVVLNANNLTISAGITLKPAGSPVRVLGLLTLNGTIDCTGSGASGLTAGAGAAPAATANVPSTGNVFSGGDAGTSGQALNSPGANNTLIASTIACGGRGGDGGRGVYTTTVRAGGSGALTSATTQYDHYHGEMQSLLQIGRADAGTSRLYLCGGGGGAGGGNSVGSGSGTLHSGGGGGAGGIAAIFARTATVGASAQVTADGGAGGNATYTSPAGNAGSGGGGGGGGGVVFVKIGQVIGTQRLPALYARGGAGGNATNFGAGYGDGGNGGNGGRVYCIVANYTGSAPTTSVAGGAAGTGSGTGGANGTAGTTGPINVYNSL